MTLDSIRNSCDVLNEDLLKIISIVMKKSKFHGECLWADAESQQKVREEIGHAFKVWNVLSLKIWID